MFFVGFHDLFLLLCDVAEVSSHCHVGCKPHLKRAFVIKGKKIVVSLK